MKEILSELYSMMNEPPWSGFERTDEEKTAIVYMAAKSIENKDIWSGVTKTELLKYFEEMGYTKEDLNKTIMMNDVTFKRGQDVLKEIGGKDVWVPMYVPTLGIRLLAKEYLDRHPEMNKSANI